MSRLQLLLNPNFNTFGYSQLEQQILQNKNSNKPLSSEQLALQDYLIRLVSKTEIANVSQFHQSIPNYKPTPLVSLNSLSKNLGVCKLLVKDESKRFNLNAFKMLGASYAMAKQLSKSLDIETALQFREIVTHAKQYQNFTFATATDGNHGRAVAWAAQLFGCQSRVYMPKGSSINRLNAIKHFTPYAEITDVDYDQTVQRVAQLAKDKHWQLIQDTAWDGYTEIPDNIMRGYFSLIKEFERQSDNSWPTHVFLQAGVGSMAAAIAAYFCSHSKPTPKIIIVEPNNASCFFDSIMINDGKPHQSGSLKTLMAGLACGLPSKTAWQLLKETAFAFIKCDDEVTIDGMNRYAYPLPGDQKIISGESAAVTLGVLQALCNEETFLYEKQSLGISNQSIILLISTEGNTDPDTYRQLVK